MTYIKRISVLALVAVALAACNGDQKKISGKALMDADTLHAKFCEGDRVAWKEVTNACNNEIGKGGEGANCQVLREADKKISDTHKHRIGACKSPEIRF
jgi:hypothetical protein